MGWQQRAKEKKPTMKYLTQINVTFTVFDDSGQQPIMREKLDAAVGGDSKDPEASMAEALAKATNYLIRNCPRIERTPMLVSPHSGKQVKAEPKLRDAAGLAGRLTEEISRHQEEEEDHTNPHEQ